MIETGPQLQFRRVGAPIELGVVQELVARRYHRLARPDLTPEAVKAEFYSGNPSPWELATIVAEDRGVLAGTLQVAAVANQQGIRPCSVAELMKPPFEWEAIFGGSLDQVAEIGRFAIDDGFTQPEDQRAILKGMVDEARRQARDHGYPIVTAIMPPYIRSIVEQSGVIIRKVPDIGLRQDYHPARRLYERYPIYWQPNRHTPYPGVYIFE